MSTLNTSPARRPFSAAAADFGKKFALQIMVLILLAQLSLAVSWAWTWLLYWNDQFSPVFIRIAAVVGTALAAGLIMRVFLRDHKRVLRWLSALVSSIVSLACLAFITAARVGIPFSLTPIRATNWDGLAQVLLAGLVSWLSLYAWIRPPSALQSAEEAAPLPETASAPLVQASPVNETATPAVSAVVPAPPAATRHLPAWLRWPWQRTVSNNVPVPPVNTSVPVVHVRKPIRLIGMEEHRCPYCLEPVEPNDPAGVEICPVCHAHHHRACWNVTGSCQVPHIQRS